MNERHMPKLILLLMLLLFLCTACAQTRQLAKRPLIDEGELYLYSEPFPQDAARLRFSIQAVAAIREDGLRVFLKPQFLEFGSAELRRQRLFARGILPPGRYTAIAVTVKDAALMGKDGLVRLLTPDKPFESGVDFRVRNGKASVVALALKPRELVPNGISFQPSFQGTVPLAPLSRMTGYVSNRTDNTITVFDKRSARIGAVIATGAGPSGMVLDQPRMRAYVALAGEDAIGVIDVKANDMVERIRLNPGDAPCFLALTPDGRFMVTANSGSNSASILDAQSRTELARIPVGNGAEYVVMDPNGRRAYVSCTLSNKIYVIDLATRLLAGTIATESGPRYAQFNRSGDRLYVIQDMSPNLLVVTPNLLGSIQRINAGIGTSSLKVNTFTDQLYLGKTFGGIIDIYDPFTLIAGDFMNAAGGAGYLTIDGEEGTLLVLHPRQRLLRFLDLVSKDERHLLDTGLDPYCVVVFGER